MAHHTTGPPPGVLDVVINWSQAKQRIRSQKQRILDLVSTKSK
jgi:hypothetical protein